MGNIRRSESNTTRESTGTKILFTQNVAFTGKINVILVRRTKSTVRIKVTLDRRHRVNTSFFSDPITDIFGIEQTATIRDKSEIIINNRAKMRVNPIPAKTLGVNEEGRSNTNRLFMQIHRIGIIFFSNILCTIADTASTERSNIDKTIIPVFMTDRLSENIRETKKDNVIVRTSSRITILTRSEVAERGRNVMIIHGTANTLEEILQIRLIERHIEVLRGNLSRSNIRIPFDIRDATEGHILFVISKSDERSTKTFSIDIRNQFTLSEKRDSGLFTYTALKAHTTRNNKTIGKGNRRNTGHIRTP